MFCINENRGIVVLKIIAIMTIVVIITVYLTKFVSDNYEDMVMNKIQAIVEAKGNNNKKIVGEEKYDKTEESLYEESTEEDIEDEIEEYTEVEENRSL